MLVCSPFLANSTSILEHSHKKRKDSLGTRTERAVLLAYVENHAILKPILLCRASKHNKRKGRAIKTVSELPFFFLCNSYQAFFLSSVKIQTCQDQTL